MKAKQNFNLWFDTETHRFLQLYWRNRFEVF